MNEVELQLYAEQLRMDLEKAAEEDLVPGWEDGDGTMRPYNSEDEEDPTRIKSVDEGDRHAESSEDDIVGTCILHPFLVLFPQLISLILLLFHLFPVSIIVISVIHYDISGCSYSYSSTRIFITHCVHMLLFTPLFLYATLFHTSLTCVWLSCLRTSLPYFLSQLVSSTTLFSRSLLYLVTGISLLVRRITTLSPPHTHCSLEYLPSPAAHSTGSTLSH